MYTMSIFPAVLLKLMLQDGPVHQVHTKKVVFITNNLEQRSFQDKAISQNKSNQNRKLIST